LKKLHGSWNKERDGEKVTEERRHEEGGRKSRGSRRWKEMSIGTTSEDEDEE